MKDVLTNKGLIEPLYDRQEDDGYTNAQWELLDAKAKATIRLHLAESIFFTIIGHATAKELWDSLCSTWESKSASNKVFLMKKLFQLQMKDSAIVSSHLNEFNSLFSQLTSKGLNLDDEMKTIFLLCSLPSSWDTFCTAISNSAPSGTLIFNDVMSAMLTEEIHRQSLDSRSHGEANVSRGPDSNRRGRSRDCDGKKTNQSRSKSRDKKNVECFYCKKKGHIKRDCHKWQKQQKEKSSDTNDKGSTGTSKSSVKIEELNVVESPAIGIPHDVLIFTSDFSPDALITLDECYSQNWIVDSGASFHVTPHKEWFSSYAVTNGSVKLGDSHQLAICGIGDIKLCMRNGTEFILKNVRHVPKLTKSLMSVGQLDDLGYNIVFHAGSWLVKKGNLVILKGQKFGSLYSLYVSSVKEHSIYVAELPSTELWHSRLGHMSQKGMKILQRSGYIPVLDYSEFSLCEHCIYGKHTRLTSRPLDKELGSPLDLVHSDLCGPMPVKSLGGASYFLTFIDDSTRKVWVYLLKNKSDTFDAFKKFLAMVENQSGRKLKTLRTDNGGEYVSSEFKNFCSQKGIARQYTTPYTPAQNGVAERMNRTIQERVTSMLSTAHLPQEFWGEAVMTAIYIINRSPSTPLHFKIPSELWSGKKPNYDRLRVFGCEAYSHVPKELRHKLDPKSHKCIFIGYGVDGEMGYRLWHPESHKVIRSSQVIFHESKMHKQAIPEVEYRRVRFEDVPFSSRAQNADNSGIPTTTTQITITLEQTESSNQALRRSTRESRAPERFQPGLDYILVTDCGEPTCYEEAIQLDDSAKWELAMQSEYHSILANDTWELTPLPEGKQALPCKWVYKKKFTAEDPEPKYKARLVAKGFKQKQGVDFDEIFSPVVKMTTLRLVLGLVASEDMELIQMDVKTAFLHGDLDEDVYMKQPAGFEEKPDPTKGELVCKLKKALYGLRQGSRQWYIKFDTYIQSQGYVRSQEDHCLYTKKLNDGSLIILVLYVDDMLIAGKSKDEITMLKNALSKQFAMKDLGDAHHFLGIRIKRDRKRGILELCQEEYIHKVLQRFNMQGGKSLSTPMEAYLKLGKNDCPKSDSEKAEMAKVPYSSVVGSLMYAMVSTRPDIAYAVGVVSRYMANPGKRHWQAVKHILRYLKGTASKCLRFGNSELSIDGYTDSDYAGCVDTRRSTSGYVFLFAGAAVSWRSCLQRCTSSSTTEAEYVAISSACVGSKEAVWLSRLVGDLGIHQVPVLHCDSQSAIALAKNPVFHSKTKHIDVRYHVIRDILASKRIDLVKVHTDDNPADAMTKSLSLERFAHCIELMGVG